LQTQKVKSKLKTLILPKIIGIFLGLGWVLFLGFILYYTFSQIIIAISLSMIIIFTIIAMVIYTQDIITITQINYGASIIETQERIVLLQASIVNSVRVLWLQLPFYTTCYITNKLAATGGIQFWIIQIPITLLFAWLAIFLFKNISLKETNRKWVKGFLRGYGLSRVSKAMEFIKEIEEFKKDLV
jgi:magnesium-transporting ATPase (P-type)